MVSKDATQEVHRLHPYARDTGLSGRMCSEDFHDLGPTSLEHPYGMRMRGQESDVLQVSLVYKGNNRERQVGIIS